MLKKTIKYVDFDGNEREDTFLFNLTRAECIEMQADVDDGFDGLLKRISEEKNPKMILETFKMIVMKSYGEKSYDGKHFVKTPELAASFAATEAYSELLMELVTNSEAAAEFINGIIPKSSLPKAATE